MAFLSSRFTPAECSSMRTSAAQPCLRYSVESRFVRSAIQKPAKCSAVASSSTSAAFESSNSAPAFVNRQKFLVPEEAVEPFETAWNQRASHMKTMQGFLDFNVVQNGEEFCVESSWASIPEWEAFSCSKEARRHHLPSGIYQYVPAEGEGFPEDFVPFVDMNTFVVARYPKVKKAPKKKQT